MAPFTTTGASIDLTIDLKEIIYFFLISPRINDEPMTAEREKVRERGMGKSLIVYSGVREPSLENVSKLF